MKVLFVINPRSGNLTSQNMDSLIQDQAHKLDFEYLIYRMSGPDEEDNIRYQINSFGPDIVAGAGGDGTVNLLAGILANTPVILLIIPYGSANGMARELEIGNRPEQAISLLRAGQVKPIDLIKINGRICIHLADVGVNARVVKRFTQDTRRGILTYARHLFGEIFLLKHYKFIINTGNREIRRKAVSITFANASKYGTGAVINPNGRIDDGKFELVIVKPFPNIKLLSIAWKMFTHTLHTSDYVEVIPCSAARILCSKKTTLQIDGEVIGKVREFNIEMMHHALNVMVPSIA